MNTSLSTQLTDDCKLAGLGQVELSLRCRPLRKIPLNLVRGKDYYKTTSEIPEAAASYVDVHKYRKF